MSASKARSRPLRLAVNTGGGDAPGLNAVIRAVVLSALNKGWEVLGIQRGYQGLWEEDGVVPLDRMSVEAITNLGGTILGTTNRENPFAWPRTRSDGSIETIDNDLASTQVSFGFRTAVQTATDAIDKLHSTARSHERIMVVELMGRHTGWIALFAGISGSADSILIPEIPFRVESVARGDESKIFPRASLCDRGRCGGSEARRRGCVACRTQISRNEPQVWRACRAAGRGALTADRHRDPKPGARTPSEGRGA